MCFYLVKRKSGLELTTTTQNILLRPLHAKERSVARIPDKDSRLGDVVLEYFEGRLAVQLQPLVRPAREARSLRYGFPSSTRVNSDATACQRPLRFTKTSIHR